MKSDDSLFMLATTYYRSGQVNQAYYILKESPNPSAQCRYLFANCAYELERSVGDDAYYSVTLIRFIVGLLKPKRSLQKTVPM